MNEQKMNYEHVLSPIKIGPMTLKNRVSFTPVWPSFATADGHVNRELIEWVRDIVKGGAACINIGCGCVNRNLPPFVTHLLRMSEESVVNEMTILSDLVHMYQCKIGIELFAINMYGGNFADRDHNGDKPAVELDPTYMTKEQIKEYIEDFALAAERAVRCGVDSLVIHGAHGQLPGCFLNKRINERTDEYGADTIENASRFTVELLAAVREKIKDRLAIEYRINANDMIEGSPSLDEVIAFVKRIEPYIDLLHVSRGMHSEQKLAPYMNQPIYYDHGINIEDAAKIRKEISVPVTVVGSVTLEQAEQYIAEGKADMVSMARGLMADPMVVKNAKSGCPENTRPCVRCNYCINRTHYDLAPVRCSVNAELGMETLYMNLGNTLPKRIAVIGGGPAGIEAARTAAQRGQERVSVHLNSEVRAEDLKGKDYDAVIVAVGAEPVIPKFAKGREDVVWVGDVELGKVSAKKQVVIVGAGLTGCEAALSLAKAGKEVTLVDMIDVCDFGRGGAKFNQIALRGLLEAEQVKMIGGVKMNIEGDRIVFVKNEKTIELSYEQIILSLGVKANEEKVQAFADAGREVVFVGDCNTKIGTLYHAVHTAHEAASVL